MSEFKQIFLDELKEKNNLERIVRENQLQPDEFSMLIKDMAFLSRLCSQITVDPIEEKLSGDEIANSIRSLEEEYSPEKISLIYRNAIQVAEKLAGFLCFPPNIVERLRKECLQLIREHHEALNCMNDAQHLLAKQRTQTAPKGLEKMPPAVTRGAASGLFFPPHILPSSLPSPINSETYLEEIQQNRPPRALS